MKKTLFVILAMVVLYVAVRDGWQYYRAFSTQNVMPTPTPMPVRIAQTPPPLVNGNISVISPSKDARVALPFTVSGSARVFEGVVAIVIKDPARNTDLYRSNAALTQALDSTSPSTSLGTGSSPPTDTRQSGSFTHTITHLDAAPAFGTVVLEVFWHSPQDGEPLDIVSIPLTMDMKETRTVKVFFTNTRLDPEITCTKVFPQDRIVAKNSAPASAAVELLMKGPTVAEREGGYETVISSEVKIPRLAIAQGTATIDFSNDLQGGVAGSCKVQAIRAQIEKTLYQFPNISGVEITVEGQKEGILQP